MKKNIFAVCDLEAAYAQSFTEYLSRRNSVPFEVHAFTSASALETFAAEHSIELLLISSKALSPGIRELNIGKIVVLSEGSSSESGLPYPTVYKYQASAQVLQETMAAYSETGRQAEPFPVLKRSTRVYGIYSPAGGCGKTSLALTLAQELGKTRPTLFLCLEGCSGLETVLGNVPSRGSLSDLLYYARQRDGKLIHRLSSMVRPLGEADAVPPVRLPQDIHQTCWEDLEFLLRELLAKSTYEALVLDVGNEVPEVLSLLELCDRILMPEREDVPAALKLAQFEASARLSEAEGMLNRVTRLTLPRLRENPSPEQYAQYLIWSELGDRVRTLLSGREDEL